MNSASITPKSAMLLSSVGLIIMGFLAYHWISAPIWKLSDLTQFTGTVNEAKEYQGKQTYLEITLSGHPLPFRCFSSVYPSGFDKALLARIGPGAPVSLGVVTSEVASPRRNWAQNQKFHEFITMTLDEHPVLLIDAYNRNTENTRRFGPWFCLVMGVVCLGLFSVAYRHRHSRQPLTILLKKK